MTIRVDLPLDTTAWSEAADRFHDEHVRRYGYDQRAVAVEVVTLRVTAIGALPKPRFARRELGPADAEAARVARRPVVFAEGSLDTPVYDRPRLEPGACLCGPALVVQADCTTLIHPGQRASVDALGNLIVTTGAATHAGEAR